jgi:arylsulfatase A-like enzyme
MFRLKRLKSIFLLAIITSLSHMTYGQRNVLIIIADDLGSDYCGFYESHIDTVNLPNVRRLLKTGVRFKNAWSNPFCSPTRAGILTGRYSFRTGVGAAIGGNTSAVLDTAEITIPKLLTKFKPAGIAKAHIGKWHLQTPTPKTNFTFPNKMGYDHYEGSFTGELANYFNWTKITNGTESTSTNYASTENADNAISFIKKNKDISQDS